MDGPQLWATVRHLTDVELATLERRIGHVFAPLASRASSRRTDDIELHVGATTHHVRVDVFVREFLATVHAQLHVARCGRHQERDEAYARAFPALTSTLPTTDVLDASAWTKQVVVETRATSSRVRTKNRVDDDSDDRDVNYPAAKLYAFLIRNRFVSSTCAELERVLSLVARTDCHVCTDKSRTDFCARTQCLEFAVTVFRGIESLLARLGHPVLTLVLECLRTVDGQAWTALRRRLEHVATQREEQRVAESARIGCPLPVELVAKSAVLDVALPFNDTTDSRVHFRLPRDAHVFTNREHVRDAFVNLLRHFQQRQNSWNGMESADVMRTAARSVLADALPANKWWLSTFFVLELIQVGSNPLGESDKDLVQTILRDKHVVEHPDRLCKLRRRFSRPKTKATRVGVEKRKKPRAGALDDAPRASSLPSTEPVTRLFSDTQLFFFYFLAHCDSYEFSELVKHQLAREFRALQDAHAQCAVDARRDFTDVALRLKVVAKFLGYLRFAPQWHVSMSIASRADENAAFQALEQQGIETLERVHDAHVDVKHWLEQSIVDASLAKCLPWLCDYLSMLSLDRLSLRTRYFEHVLVLLQLVHRSPRLDALGETGVYLAMQIEKMLQLLDVDMLDARSWDEWRHVVSMELQTVLACSEVVDGQDTLPFLYSQVLVQTCVSEVDDLRAFLQTQVQAHRLCASKSTPNPVVPLRKLRPLQVDAKDEDRTVDARDLLADALFKVQPSTKPVVDFVVASVTTDVCAYVLTHLVMPRADQLVARCVARGLERNVSHETRDARIASCQQLVTARTFPEAHATVRAALDAAMKLADARLESALPSLLSPSLPRSITRAVVEIARERTRSALRALVAKSSHSTFHKRVASRIKSLGKERGVVENTWRDTGTDETTQRCVELKRQVAAMAQSAGVLDKAAIASKSEWEARTAAVSRSMSAFMLLFTKCVDQGDMTGAVSGLHVSALVLWDLIWRAITSCLTFIELSLALLTALELTDKCERHVEKVWQTFVAEFAAMLQVLTGTLGASSDQGKKGIQTTIAYVMACVQTQQLKWKKAVANPLVVEASTLVVASVREVAKAETMKE
ncbi:hypothetical protein PsorP6_017439 [Peronosclerospora sorghi]|uniref:Uncharacterized protein n=1 Tax=Peronosclerospora sorghi TaxID=230839 RepID=A0ACC0WNX1_9STRA|nr:hypothetical protein PsorP6_017439 [Peronosclerospora sorghi]